MSRKRDNLRLAGRLVAMAAGSFAFGYALVPLYDVFCEVTGIGSRDRLLQAAAVADTGPDAERTALLGKAAILTRRFNSLSQELGQVRQNLNTELGVGVEEVNRLTGQIAKLNERIGAAEAGQTTANDLRDQRNQLLEELSGWAGITYLEQEDGSVTVHTREGLLLERQRELGPQRRGRLHLLQRD